MSATALATIRAQMDRPIPDRKATAAIGLEIEKTQQLNANKTLLKARIRCFLRCTTGSLNARYTSTAARTRNAMGMPMT